MQESREEATPLQLSLVAPSGGLHSLRVSSLDSPAEIKACLQDFAPLSFYTNYHYEVEGKVLSDYEDFGQQGVVTGATLRMVADPYNERTVKLHVSRINEILTTPPSASCYLIGAEELADEVLQPAAEVPIPTIGTEDFLPDPSKLPHATSLLHPLATGDELWTLTKCMHDINFERYNPPTSRRLLKGDISYLDLHILEGQHVHVTASSLGFYINASSSEPAGTFRPEQSEDSVIYTTLVDLLEQVSPLFKSNLQVLFKSSSADWENLRRIKSLIEVDSWVGEDQEKWRSSRLEELRDWNEELQLVRSLPDAHPVQRINKEKTVAKVYGEFVEAAIQGARAVVAGAFQPLNPNETCRTKQIFIHNNIFFSFTEDREYAQDAGLEVCPSDILASHDLRACRILDSMDIPDLHTIGTAIVDYRGFRLLCQSVLPGIMNSSAEQNAKYGSMDECLVVHSDPEFHTLAKAVAERMHLSESKVVDAQGQAFDIALGYDVKGLLGSDCRKYFLENARIVPRDSNRLGEENVLCLVRPELLEHFQQAKNRLFVDSKIDNVIQEKRKVADDPEQVHLTMEELKEIVGSAPIYTFNPNVFTRAKLALANQEEEEAKVRELGDFLKKTQIPMVCRILCSEESSWPRLGISIVDVLHQFGVNARYLGAISTEMESRPEKKCVKWQVEIAATARAVKHVFGRYLRDTPDHLLAAMISHLLNCVFSLPSTEVVEELKEGKKKRKKNKVPNLPKAATVIHEFPLLNLTKEEVWTEVATFALRHFELNLPAKLDLWEAVQLPSFRTCFLREICLQTGIQIAPLSLLDKFTPESIASLMHRVKTLDWKSADSKWLYEAALKALNEKNSSQAIELLIQSASVQANTSGPIHKDVALCYQRISNVYFAENELVQALLYQHKAIIIYERALGLDHPVVAQNYINFAYLYQAVGRQDRSFKHILRACDLFALNGCEHSTDSINALSSLAALYSEANLHDMAIWTLVKVLESYMFVNGENHLSVGECSQILAYEYRTVKDYDKAVQAQAKAVSVFSRSLPQDDQRLRDALAMLEAYQRLATGGEPSAVGPKATRAEKTVRTDRNSMLRQRLHMRKLQAKMNLPRSQMSQFYSDLSNAMSREQLEEEKTKALIEEIARKKARK
jgi:protein TIF31